MGVGGGGVGEALLGHHVGGHLVRGDPVAAARCGLADHPLVVLQCFAQVVVIERHAAQHQAGRNGRALRERLLGLGLGFGEFAQSIVALGHVGQHLGQKWVFGNGQHGFQALAGVHRAVQVEQRHAEFVLGIGAVLVLGQLQRLLEVRQRLLGLALAGQNLAPHQRHAVARLTLGPLQAVGFLNAGERRVVVALGQPELRLEVVPARQVQHVFLG